MNEGVGGQKVRIWYEPDTGFVCTVYAPGIVDADTATYVVKATDAYVDPDGTTGAAFMLIDLRFTTGATAEARRAFAQGWEREGRFDGQYVIAVFGGSFIVRTLAKLLLRGQALLYPKLLATVEADETAARAWLTEKRRDYLARKAMGEG
ncbi:MAG TPA: hypothetical protein VM580_02675 [Labilithrix sp.]|nr:hypothetical protein [Labilithrix sp.]